MNHASVLGILLICSVLFFVYPNKDDDLKSGKQIAFNFFCFPTVCKVEIHVSEKLTI